MHPATHVVRGATLAGHGYVYQVSVGAGIRVDHCIHGCGGLARSHDASGRVVFHEQGV